MNFNSHSHLNGKHAILSASKSHWVNYDDEKLVEFYDTLRAASLGSELHELAAMAIKHGAKLARSRRTLNSYVNDAIGFRMTPEQVLYYSDNCFGTADAISYGPNRDRNIEYEGNVLRIHDLKTGKHPAAMRQLEVYAAMFCLEYDVLPSSILIILRIYQNDEIVEHLPEVDTIVHIMDKIQTFDRRIEQLKAEEAL